MGVDLAKVDLVCAPRHSVLQKARQWFWYPYQYLDCNILHATSDSQSHKRITKHSTRVKAKHFTARHILVPSIWKSRKWKLETEMGDG